MWGFSVSAATLLLAIASALVALRAIRTARTPQGAVGWVVFIFALPVLAIPVYFVFGNVDHVRYVRERRVSEASAGRKDKADAASQGRLAVFERLSQTSARQGNHVELLIDGRETYDAIFGAIDAAQDYLLVQFYIIRNDEIGQRLKDALIAKARDGIEVYLLHNSIVGLGLPRRFLNELREGGVHLNPMQGPKRLLGRLQLNYRNHRKLVLRDGVIAFTGGLNIGVEHLGRDRKLGDWRDTHVQVSGPSVSQLQGDFVADWFWSSGERIGDRLVWDAPDHPADMRGLVMSPAPTDVLETGNLYFGAMAALAKKRLWIATPYFVPDFDVLSALKLAALRGVEVRILVPDIADHYLPWLAAYAYFDEIATSGGEIWRYQAGFMHQKVVLVDNDVTSVGTINLDIRSGLLNFEQTVIIEDRRAAAEVEAMLAADFEKSVRLDKGLHQQALWLRIGAPAARLLAPLL
ncbi:cardiolipin synthase [Roseitranquillus sediminis]|uniref:cardiolipin synthase n=1 Tax=Roseitranquillus sediminis TaxID=2809051 RepID=UPI001D0C2250|nr:cardiolipin synthase [Roseitranquillus sediminis]MBM9593094.1 cardiolipin synthase [Roseitranquillus sediminis]